MTSDNENGLLTSRDAGPVAITNRDGPSRFLLLGDHAGNRIPERLHGLGLAPSELERHIALDIGVEGLGRRLACELDAPFVAQRYSRLVVDCNRALSHPDSKAAQSDGTVIPGNAGLTANEHAARADAIHNPYHAAIADILGERDARGSGTIIVSLHSFTPVMAGRARPWQIGVLYGGGDARFAQSVLAQLQRSGDVVVGDNEPYRFDDTDFTVPAHAISTGRAYVELEIRQDEVAAAEGRDRMAGRLASILQRAAQDYDQIAGG